MIQNKYREAQTNSQKLFERIVNGDSKWLPRHILPSLMYEYKNGV